MICNNFMRMLREVISNDMLTIIFLVQFGILVFLRLNFPLRFFDFLELPISFKYIKRSERQQFKVDIFLVMLLLNTFITIALVVFAYWMYYSQQLFEITITYFLILISVLAFFLIRFFIEYIVASFFKQRELISAFLFYRTAFLSYFGLVLLPISLVFTYILQPRLYAYILVAILGLFFYTLGLIRFLKTYQGKLKQHYVIIILYLCTFQITPYVLLINYISKYLGF